MNMNILAILLQDLRAEGYANHRTIGALDFFGKDEQNSAIQDTKQCFEQRQGVKRKISNGMYPLPYTLKQSFYCILCPILCYIAFLKKHLLGGLEKGIYPFFSIFQYIC